MIFIANRHNSIFILNIYMCLFKVIIK